MLKDLTIVKRQLETNRGKAPAYSDWLHIKTNVMYRVNDHVLRECDLVPMITYINSKNSFAIIWSRPTTEFLDGRFKLIATLDDWPVSDNSLEPTTE